MMLESGINPGSRVSQPGCGRGRWTAALLGLALSATVPASAVPIHGRLLSAAGRPFPGAEVTLVPMPSALTPETDPAPAVRATTDAQGDFSLDAPGPGLWRLRLRPTGSGTVLCDLVPLLDAVEIPTVSLPPASPAAASTPFVHCHADGGKKTAAPASRSLTLRLLAPDGKPAPGVLGEMEDGTLVGPADADGRLQIGLTGSGPTAARFWSADGAWAAVLLWPNATEVRLTPPVTIAGAVLDRATRRPLPRSLVWPAADPGRVVRSDDQGRFALKVPFLTAPSLQAATAGYQMAAVRPDRNDGLTVSLSPATAVPGLVVDEAGKPVAGAEVDVIPAEAAPPKGEVRGWSRTDASGRFHFDGLEPGERLTARVRASGFATLASTLPPLPTPSVRLVVQRGRTVLGKVVDASGRVVAGAEVRAWSADPQARPEDLLRASDREMRQTTGRDGSFSLAAVPAGPLDLSVRAKGAAPAWLRGVEVASGSSPLDIGRIVLGPEIVLRGTVVDDMGAAINGVKVTAVPATTLPRPGDLSGGPPPASLTDADGRFSLAGVDTGVRLFLRAERDGFLPATQEVEAAGGDPILLTLKPAEALTGTVVDAQGQPVEGARVALLTGSRDRLRPLASTMSDRAGAFSIAAAQPGEHHLAVQANGYRAWLQPLTVEAGSSQPVEIRLSRGAALSGRIVSERGEPIEGAGISLEAEETAGLIAPGTVSDADGAYRLEGLLDGPQQVRVLHPDYLPVNRQVQLQEDAVQNFTLKAGAALAGQVVDEKGDPVSGATVRVQAETEPISVPERWSNAEGRFRVPGLAPARYSVLVELEGYAPAELSAIEVGRGRPDLLVRLTRGATLFGQIHGVPAEERARLQVWASGPTLVQKAGTVDPEGRYRIESLGAGPWRISARAEGLGRETSAPLNLAPEQREAFLDLEFANGYALTGVVTRDGNAVEGALVSVHGLDSAGAVTGPQGRFRIGPLTPGTYQVVVLDRASGTSRAWNFNLDNDRETVFELPALKRRESP